MERQPQNPAFRIHPENFHPCTSAISTKTSCDDTNTLFDIVTVLL